MKLSKIKPASTVTFTAESCTENYLAMSPKFRAIRSRMRNPMDKCHWCKHPFEDGEMMALAFTKKGNKTLCQACASELIKSKTEETETTEV
jgi:rRNA maturation endonuclease Nob1